MANNTKLTTEEFIKRARAAHGDRYDYSKSVYKGAHTKVEIICKTHGSFFQNPSGHASQKQGCIKCAGKSKPTTEEFIAKAREVHGDRYDYSKAVYGKNNGEGVEIICKIHGGFFQSPNRHVSHKQGCMRCAGKYRPTTEEFIEKARKVHGDRYDYSKTIYGKNNGAKVEIVCKAHGSFFQSPDHHLNQRSGCPACGVKKICAKRRLTTEEFIVRAREVHGDRYGYSAVVCKGAGKEVEIVCKVHGSFLQEAGAHYAGCGCPKCAIKEQGIKSRLTTKQFIERARKTHGDRCDYSRTMYSVGGVDVEVVCREHGSFFTDPSNHVGSGAGGTGCPRCAKYTTDNDSVYVLRVVGLKHRGLPVYKIGVTSKRLGDMRLNRLRGVTGKQLRSVAQVFLAEEESAKHLEGTLLQIGGLKAIVPFKEADRFEGYTECRAWSGKQLAISLRLLQKHQATPPRP